MGSEFSSNILIQFTRFASAMKTYNTNYIYDYYYYWMHSLDFISGVGVEINCIQRNRNTVCICEEESINFFLAFYSQRIHLNERTRCKTNPQNLIGMHEGIFISFNRNKPKVFSERISFYLTSLANVVIFVNKISSFWFICWIFFRKKTSLE